jgi:uncharacterized metal-binding protein (TIGR02443 family)
MMKKQFIAGAKCTQCGEQDKVRLCRDGEREWIECVACGHSEERPKTVVTKDPDEVHAELAPESSGAVKWMPKR